MAEPALCAFPARRLGSLPPAAAGQPAPGVAAGFLPKFLAVLLILDGFADLLWFLQGLLLPAFPAISYPAWALSFIAEVGLTLWLLIKGVRIADPGARLPG